MSQPVNYPPDLPLLAIPTNADAAALSPPAPGPTPIPFIAPTAGSAVLPSGGLVVLPTTLPRLPFLVALAMWASF